MYCTNIISQKAGMAILTSDKVDLRIKKITRDREWALCIKKKGQSNKKTAILNVYASNNRVAKYMKKKLLELKEETDKSKIVAGDVNTCFSTNG